MRKFIKEIEFRFKMLIFTYILLTFIRGRRVSPGIFNNLSLHLNGRGSENGRSVYESGAYANRSGLSITNKWLITRN